MVVPAISKTIIVCIATRYEQIERRSGYSLYQLLKINKTHYHYQQVPTDGPAPWQQQSREQQQAAPLLTQLVATSVNIALKSGEIIRSIMSQGDLGIVEKGVNDLQTQADR